MGIPSENIVVPEIGSVIELTRNQIRLNGSVPADLTGSVAMASASDLKKNASANAMKSLQGKMAGVHITTNGGNPAEEENR